MPAELTRIFLLSHMRAFTSLAGHILGSHPQINGYYEMHLAYADGAALERQLAAYLEGDVLKENSRFLFDKLLHNDYPLRLELPGLADAKVLVSLLEPSQTIRSIIDLFSGKEGDDPYASAEGAAAYYVARLEALTEFCTTSAHPYFYYDAELFQGAPERLLSRLADWLELDVPLSERYQIFSHTGKPRKGDTSARIQTGCIDRTPVDYSHIPLPLKLLTQAQQVYDDCRGKIVMAASDSLLKG